MVRTKTRGKISVKTNWKRRRKACLDYDHYSGQVVEFLPDSDRSLWANQESWQKMSESVYRYLADMLQAQS